MHGKSVTQSVFIYFRFCTKKMDSDDFNNILWWGLKVAFVMVVILIVWKVMLHSYETIEQAIENQLKYND
jgi:hypothetical protein